MKHHALVQGSPEWLAYRATARNASDAPAVLGCSPYQTRDQFLHARYTGIKADVNAAQQRRFDDGHAIEAAQIAFAEKMVGESLYPVVGSAIIDGIELSASFDGLTLMESHAYECKTLNDNLREALPSKDINHNDPRNLPKMYRVQMQQQLMVSGAVGVLFVAASKDGQDVRCCWYTSDDALGKEIIAEWKQSDVDLANYQTPAPKSLPVLAEATESLPAVSVRLDGKLAVVSNLPDFSTALHAFIERIPKAPETDQDFANAEAACKSLKKAEDALTAGEDAALGEMVDFEAMRRQVRYLKELARSTRLATEKLVAVRKDYIRRDIVANGMAAYQAHIEALNASIGHTYMPRLPVDFGGAVKNKRMVDSLHSAVNDELARAKIAANQVATVIKTNLQQLSQVNGHSFLFADVAALVLKDPEVVAMTIKSRIADHVQAETQRVEAERAKIRAEEAARAEKELNERVAQEQKQLIAQAEHAQAAIHSIATEPAQSDNVVALPVRAPAPVTVGTTINATIKLGEINALLAPICLTADGLASLGFEPVATDKNARLYRVASLGHICAALVEHLQAVQARQAA